MTNQFNPSNNFESQEYETPPWYIRQYYEWKNWSIRTLCVIGALAFSGFIFVNGGGIIKLNFPSYAEATFTLDNKPPSPKHSLPTKQTSKQQKEMYDE